MSALSSVTIGVMGSGVEDHDLLATEIGTLLARLGVNLLTGGGRGVMTSVCRAYTTATRAKGICIGIIPCRSEGERSVPKEGYPNPYVELSIYTHLPFSGKRGRYNLSRNHINVLSSAAIVALPGGDGTATEVSLAVDYQKPIVAFAHDVALIAELPKEVQRVTTIVEVERFLKSHISPAP